MEKRLMIPGVGQAGREQARCEDRPSGEGWKQPRWSSPRRTRTTGSWLPRGSHILVQNCGWVGVKSSKLCNENTNSMYMAYLAILGILFFMIYEKTVNFLKTIMTTNSRQQCLKLSVLLFWQYSWFFNHTIVEQTYDTALREWIFGNIWELLPKRYKKCMGMNENWCELVIGSSPDSCLQPEPRKPILHFSPGFGPLGLLSKLS